LLQLLGDKSLCSDPLSGFYPLDTTWYFRPLTHAFDKYWDHIRSTGCKFIDLRVRGRGRASVPLDFWVEPPLHLRVYRKLIALHSQTAESV